MISCSHNMLMTSNIVLAVIHIVLSLTFYVLYVKKVKLHQFAFPAFFMTSIVACLLIMLYSILCIINFGKEH